MRTHQTAAAEADRELTDLLGYEARFYKEGLMDNHRLDPIRLKTTYEEANLLLFEKSVVRPAFTIEDDVIDYPCILMKVDGPADQLVADLHKWKADHVKTTLMYGGFHMIDRMPSALSLNTAQEILDGEVQLNALEQINYTAPVKQKMLIGAYHQVVEWVAEMAIHIEPYQLLAACLIDNKNVIDAFHYVSPVDSPPKCAIVDSQRQVLNEVAMVRILMMHALGFDVVIISKQSFASIENYLPAQFYDRHKVVPSSDVTLTGRETTKKLLLVAVLITVLFIMLKILNVI